MRLEDWPHDCCYPHGCDYQHRNAKDIVCCISPGGPCEYINEAVLDENGASRNELPAEV